MYKSSGSSFKMGTKFPVYRHVSGNTLNDVMSLTRVPWALFPSAMETLRADS
jgi:hypothetical protein